MYILKNVTLYHVRVGSLQYEGTVFRVKLLVSGSTTSRSYLHNSKLVNYSTLKVIKTVVMPNVVLVSFSAANGLMYWNKLKTCPIQTISNALGL